MKMNTQLGYLPVTFNDLTDDESEEEAARKATLELEKLGKEFRKQSVAEMK